MSNQGCCDLRRAMRRVLCVTVLAIALVASGSCGGDGAPASTPVPSEAISLVYATFVPYGDASGFGDGTLYERAATGGDARLIRTYPGQGLVFLLASPDGTMVALANNGKIKLVDRATGDEIMSLGSPPISTTGAGPFASFTGDSKTFAYSRVNLTGTPIADIPNSVRSGWIEIVDVPSRTIITPAWTKAVPAAQPSWNPVGDEFVAVDYGSINATNRPLIIGAADARRRTLTGDPPGNKGVPVWSPDGKRIAYSVIEEIPDGDGNLVPGGIFVVDADGKNAHFLLHARFLSPQAWSPDGERLAVTCAPEGKKTTDGVTHICIIEVDSGQVTRVTSGQGDFSPSFSPDGDTIAYLSDVDVATGTFTLRTMRLSDNRGEVIATHVPFGGMTWAVVGG